jgi:formiminotetrahydrofolate cyclodeaminase
MEKYIDLPMKQYLDDLAGPKDAPGGGSASGLVGSIAASLGSMVCNFTIGKKKYADVESRIREMLAEFESIRTAMTDLMQQDIDVFHKHMGSAFALPKDTEEQKSARKQAIEDACKRASDPPFKIVERCVQLMNLFVELAQKGNVQLVSDVGVGAAMTMAAFDGARMNVQINLNYITDKNFVDQRRCDVDVLTEIIKPLATQAQQLVREKMSK